MLTGTVDFTAKVEGKGIQFGPVEVQPREAGVKRVLVEGPDGEAIKVTVTLEGVVTAADGNELAEVVAEDVLDRLAFHHRLVIGEVNCTTSAFTPLAQPLGSTTVMVGTARLRLTPAFRPTHIVAAPAPCIKAQLEEVSPPGGRNYGLFRSALKSVGAVEQFLHLYNILLMLYADDQGKVDHFIMTEQPATPRTQSPFAPKQKRGVKETIYTRLRNEFAHKRAGVKPADIAVYCDLRFNRKDNPPPPDFVHFSGGEEDFGSFSAGNYHHIIFNQSLQEGWDDPECCFAYIDKSMESKTQVEQVIGRVLRQPGARHYQDPDLNTANFYIRIGAKQEFPQILETVRKKIAADYPEVKLERYADRKERERLRKEPKLALTVPQIHIDLEEAITFSGSQPGGPFIDAVHQIVDYRTDTVNTLGKGERMRAVQPIGDGAKAAVETAELSHSNRVMARWIVRRTVQSLYPQAVISVDWSDPRFDARVELTSLAAHTLRQAAENLVRVYLEHAQLAFEEENLYTVGPVVVNPKKYVTFTNAAHEGYGDMNALEELFAKAIDETGLRWARNPSNGGYSIPLLQTGDSRRFFPDFLVWKDGIVFALGTRKAII